MNLWQKAYVDKKLVISGAWFTLEDKFQNDEGDKVKFKIVSLSKGNLEVLHNLMQLEKTFNSEPKEETSKDLALDKDGFIKEFSTKMNAFNSFIASNVIKDWENVYFPVTDKAGEFTGEFVKEDFTVEKCLDLLDNIEGLAEHVMSFANDTTNFRYQFEQSAKKN